MQMREIMAAVGHLHEAIAYRGAGFVVIENPSPLQLRKMMEEANNRHNEGLRAILSGALYVWDGYFLNHDEAVGLLGLDGGVEDASLHLYPRHVELDIASLSLDDWDEDDEPGYKRRIVEELAEQVTQNRILVQFYGGQPRIKVDDGSNSDWLESYLSRLD